MTKLTIFAPQFTYIDPLSSWLRKQYCLPNLLTLTLSLPDCENNTSSPIYLHWLSLFLTEKTILAPQFTNIDPLSSWLRKQY